MSLRVKINGSEHTAHLVVVASPNVIELIARYSGYSHSISGKLQLRPGHAVTITWTHSDEEIARGSGSILHRFISMHNHGNERCVMEHLIISMDYIHIL